MNLCVRIASTMDFTSSTSPVSMIFFLKRCHDHDDLPTLSTTDTLRPSTLRSRRDARFRASSLPVHRSARGFPSGLLFRQAMLHAPLLKSFHLLQQVVGKFLWESHVPVAISTATAGKANGRYHDPRLHGVEFLFPGHSHGILTFGIPKSPLGLQSLGPG